MREIKFRAFDTTSKKMYSQEQIELYKLEQLNRISFGDDYTKFMQYTGLKDKNGVEIYEGDILSFDWRLQATNELYAEDCEDIKGVVKFESAKFVVRYFNESMSFCVGDINQVTFERFWRETYQRSKDAYYKMTGFKVIGNIYENSELLNAQTKK